MGLMAWLGYIKRDKYTSVVREQENLQKRVAQLERENDKLLERVKKVAALEREKKELLRRMEKMRPPALTEIKGIGAILADKLKKARIRDVRDLAQASPLKLADRIGTSEKTVSGWIDQAKRILG